MKHKLVMIASHIEQFTSGARTNVLFACDAIALGKAVARAHIPAPEATS